MCNALVTSFNVSQIPAVLDHIISRVIRGGVLLWSISPMLHYQDANLVGEKLAVVGCKPLRIDIHTPIWIDAYHAATHCNLQSILEQACHLMLNICHGLSPSLRLSVGSYLEAVLCGGEGHKDTKPMRPPSVLSSCFHTTSHDSHRAATDLVGAHPTNNKLGKQIDGKDPEAMHVT